MVHPSLIFPRSEYEGRASRLQKAMAVEGIDALLLTMSTDIFYTTGFLTRFWESPARPWFIIIPAAGAPIAVIPSIGETLMASTWVEDIRTWPAPRPEDDGVSLLVETLTEVVPEGGKIGIPMGLETHLRMPLNDFTTVRKQLGTRSIVDGTNAVQRVREIKSDAEIEKIRTTCEIAARAFDQVPTFAGAGCPLDEVFRQFQAALLHEGADWVNYVAGGAGPDGYEDVISPAQSTPLNKGDMLMLDTGAVKDGYFCDFDRNFSIGPPSPLSKKTHEILWQATEKTFEAIRPGMVAADVHRMLFEAIEREGGKTGDGRLGHGLGVSLTEWPSFTPHDQTPLRAGMVLTLEPSAQTKHGRLLVHEENIVLRNHGAEWLSPRAPFTLPELS